MLVEELKQLRRLWGSDTQEINKKYGPILDEERDQLEKSEIDNAQVVAKIEALESLSTHLREQYL